MNWTIFRAQLWELWRLTRSEIGQRFIIVAALSMTLGGAFNVLIEDGISNTVFPLIMSLVFGLILLCVITPFFYAGSANPAQGVQGFIRSHCARPIATPQLLGVPLAYGLLVSTLYGVCTLGFLRIVFALDYPVVSSLLITLPIGLTIYCLACGTRTAGRFICLFLPLVVFLYFFLFTVPETMNFPLGSPDEWRALFAIPASRYMGLYGIAVSSLIFALWSVEKIRHDHSDLEFAISGGAARWTPGGAGLRAPFTSALHAQIWFELRRAGRVVAELVGVGVPLVLALAIPMELGMLSPQQLFGMLAIVVFTSPFVLLVGSTDPLSGMRGQSSARDYSVFDATQGTSVGRCIAIKSAVVMLVSMVGCLFFYGTAALLALRYGAEAPTGKFAKPIQFLISLADVPGIGMVAIVVVPVCALTVVLLALDTVYVQRRGSAKVDLAITVCSVTVVPAYGILFILGRERNWDLSAFWGMHAFAIGVYFAYLSFRGLWRARRRELLPTPWILGALGVWLIFVVTVLWGLSLVRPDISVLAAIENFPLTVFCAGLLCIPLGSAAWAPLALDGQRSQ